MHSFLDIILAICQIGVNAKYISFKLDDHVEIYG